MSDPPVETPVPAFVHRTVLRDEVVRAIGPRPGGVYLDVTLGGGGHTEALLEASAPDGLVVGIDRDPTARAAAGARLSRFGSRVRVCAGTMASALRIVRAEGFERVDGLVADLGVSSPQLDDHARGMSFRPPAAPLDMRMDPTQGLTARELIDTLDEKELADVIYRYGEERASRPIARAIKRSADEGTLHTTLDLARAVYRVLGPPRGKGIDPATRTFQALRIAVNDELGELEALLGALPELLSMGGVAAIISFHSLEDRLVKHAFRDGATLWALTKKPVEAGDEELAVNPRSRSAKLRAARRVDPAEPRPARANKYPRPGAHDEDDSDTDPDEGEPR